MQRYEKKRYKLHTFKKVINIWVLITLMKINDFFHCRTKENAYLCSVANELQEFFEISASKL